MIGARGDDVEIVHEMPINPQLVAQRLEEEKCAEVCKVALEALSSGSGPWFFEPIWRGLPARTDGDGAFLSLRPFLLFFPFHAARRI